MEIKTTLKILHKYELLDRLWNHTSNLEDLRTCQKYESKRWVAVDDIIKVLDEKIDRINKKIEQGVKDNQSAAYIGIMSVNKAPLETLKLEIQQISDKVE